MSDNQNINWYPGHMAKTRRKIVESLKLVDAVIEIKDARIPYSSSNPDIAEIVGPKPRIVLLNKSDLANANITNEWISFYKKSGIIALPIDCKTGFGIKQFFAAVNSVLQQKVQKNKDRGINKALRFLVVGIPNVGKSSFINRLCDKKAKVEDRPGVTRGNQWFSAKNNYLFLDTPGVLWPKFEDSTVGEHLAITGAVKDTVLNIEEIAVSFLNIIKSDYGNNLKERYSVDYAEDSYFMLEAIGKARGMLVHGGETDTERAATMLIDEFRAGKIGRISLERPE